jgi:general secretion pathway protein K
MKAQILATIESEGGKIDINDLASPAKALREGTKNQILKIFQAEMENDEVFREKYSTFDFNELLNSIIDWVDEDTESLNGGSENGPYKDELASEMIPPNRPFKTLKELLMVDGMTDEFFQLLIERVTIYGSKGINVNYSNAEVLMALDPQLTKENAEAIIARRQNQELGGLFKNEEDFLSFLTSAEVNINIENFNEEGIPLLFNEEFNFRIKSTGNFGEATREIIAITYDTDSLKERLITLLDKQDDEESKAKGQEESGSNPQQPPESGKNDPKNEDNKDGKGDGKKTDDKPKIKPPKGRPTIVYWEEI